MELMGYVENMLLQCHLKINKSKDATKSDSLKHHEISLFIEMTENKEIQPLFD